MTRGSLMARGEFYNGEDLTIVGWFCDCRVVLKEIYKYGRVFEEQFRRNFTISGVGLHREEVLQL